MIALADLIVATGLASASDLAAAEKRAATDNTSTLAELVRAGGLDCDGLAAELRRRTQLVVLAADELGVDEDAIRALPHDLARQYLALPLGLDLDSRPPRMRVAFANPLDEVALREVERASGFRLDPAIAPGNLLEAAIGRAYATLITRSIPRRAPYAVSPSGKVLEPSTRPAHRLLDDPLLDLRLRALGELLVEKGLLRAGELDERVQKLLAAIDLPDR